MAQLSHPAPHHSTIGLKVLVAVTGVALLLFTIVHMLGNLQVFISSNAINSYAYHLQSLPVPILWGARFGLLLMLILHIFAIIQLIRINRSARVETYDQAKPHGATWASRTMALSGFIVLFFILFHLWQFTIRGTPFNGYNSLTSNILIDGQTVEVPDVFKRVVQAFSNPLLATFYVVAVGLLCLHLSHGAQSLFRTLGLGNRGTFGWQTFGAKAIALLIFFGMAAVPISVLLKVVR